jgi:hypothetical protein
MKRLLCVIALSLVVASALAAQGQMAPDPPQVKADPSPPQLTEMEALSVQNAALQQQLTNLNMALEACHIEAAHPGYKLDPQKGLVKKSQP